MKYISAEDIPMPLRRAIDDDQYTKGAADFSVTEIIGPPLLSVAMGAMNEHLTDYYENALFRLYGTITHDIISKYGGDDGEMLEQRYTIEVDGHTVSGAMDQLLVGTRLDDYKFTSYYAATGKLKPEWEAQLNIYRYMAILHGLGPIEEMSIVALIRDWGKRLDHNRPPPHIMRLMVPVWDEAKLLTFLKERVAIHARARSMWESGGIPDQCTDDERWATQRKFAVMRKGRKTAIRLADTMDQAEEVEAAEKNQAGLYIEERPREFKRCCDEYCELFMNQCCPYVNGARFEEVRKLG